MSAPRPRHPCWRPGLTFSVQEGAARGLGKHIKGSGRRARERVGLALCTWPPGSPWLSGRSVSACGSSPHLCAHQPHLRYLLWALGAARGGEDKHKTGNPKDRGKPMSAPRQRQSSASWEKASSQASSLHTRRQLPDHCASPCALHVAQSPEAAQRLSRVQQQGWRGTEPRTVTPHLPKPGRKTERWRPRSCLWPAPRLSHSCFLLCGYSKSSALPHTQRRP